MTSSSARLASAAILLLMVVVYYASGPRFQLWPDSGGYLVQAFGLAGQGSYDRPGGRGVGYPLLFALALRTPWPFLAIWVMQAAITAAALLGVYLALTRWVLRDMAPRWVSDRAAASAALLLVSLASLYSILHIQAGALLTETLFAGLALAAVLATIWYGRLAPGARSPRLKAAAVALVIGLNLSVKPHWFLAAAILGAVVTLRLWQLTPRSGPLGHAVPRALLALALPAAVIIAAGLPDRMLAERYNPREMVLFGPRTAFCNHLHLIDATLARRPGMTLQDDPVLEAAIRERYRDQRKRYRGGWKRLGFDGDLCSYDPALSKALDQRFPEPRAQASFLLGALWRAALSDPWPYVTKVLRHLVYGFTSSFEKFAHHSRLGPDMYPELAAAYKLKPRMARGVTIVASIGPLAGEAEMRQTLHGRLLQAVLAVTFFGLAGLLCLLTLLMLAVPLRWRALRKDARRDWLVFVAVPLLALLSHHGVVAMTHSFDIWRYAFNMFFVNLLLIGTASAFILRHGLRHWPMRSAPEEEIS